MLIRKQTYWITIPAMSLKPLIPFSSDLLIYLFVYLFSSIVSKTGGIEEDVKARTAETSIVCNTLKPVVKNENIRLGAKIRRFISSVQSVWLYGAGT